MKLILLLLFPLSILAQDIPKGADGIKLITSIPDSLLFEQVMVHLNENEYSVNKADKIRGFITTDYKASSGLLSMRILVTVKNGLALFKGQWSASAMGYSFTNEPVRFRGMMGSNEKKSFLNLDKTVTSLKNVINQSSIEYSLPTAK